MTEHTDTNKVPKRPTLEILIDVDHEVSMSMPDGVSISYISKELNTTWRTAKRCLDCLVQLGLARKSAHEAEVRIKYYRKTRTRKYMRRRKYELAET